MTQDALDTSILLRWFSQYHDADTDRALRLRQEQQEERVRIAILDTTLCELAHMLKEANRFSQGDIDAALASLGYTHKQVVPCQAPLSHEEPFESHTNTIKASILPVLSIFGDGL